MKNLLEKIFIILGDLIIGDKNKSSSFSFNKIKMEKDQQTNNSIFFKQVWIDGKFWTVMANSEKELQEKVSKITPDITLFKDKEYFNILNNFYTEDIEREENEWIKKRDVWINEYYQS